MNFDSTSVISGSEIVRPSSRLSEPTVLRKLEISRVFAGSPIERCLGPNETRDLA